MTRVLFFGMTSAFSIPPLESMLEAGVDVGAVILPARSTPAAGDLPRRIEPPPALSDLPVIDPYLSPNILHLAWRRNIPAWEVGPLSDPTTLATLAAVQPDLVVVACFSTIFPQTLLQLPRRGCLNLHPSLLPAYRGPAPLFWQARQGEARTGVTLHFLDEGVDSGDIVAQTAFDWPEGLSGAELEQRGAMAGARLLLAALRQLEQGRLPRRPQPQAGRSYFPWPSGPDFIIPTDWPARRAFNFLRGAAKWPLVIKVGPGRFPIRAAISYDPEQTLDQPCIIHDDELWVQFKPGVVRCRL